MRCFNLVVGLVAIAVFAFAYSCSRTPDCLNSLVAAAVLLLFTVFFVIAFLIALVKTIRRWRTWRLNGLLAVGAIPLALFLGSRAGNYACDARFRDWRLPVYSRLVARELARSAQLRDADHSIYIKLSSEEKEVANSVTLSMDDRSQPVFDFDYARVGPPNHSWIYRCVTDELAGAPRRREAPGRWLVPGWYEVYD